MTRILAIPLLVLASSTAVAASESPRARLPFIPDDYPRALAEARSRRLPLFIEAWAPW